MTISQSTPESVVWVAIDVAKDSHEALIEAPGWKSRKKVRVIGDDSRFNAGVSLVGPFQNDFNDGLGD